LKIQKTPGFSKFKETNFQKIKKRNIKYVKNQKGNIEKHELKINQKKVKQNLFSSFLYFS